MQPINYGAYFQRPKTQDLGLYDYVKEIEGIRRERDFRNDLADLQGNYTSEKASNLMLKYPGFQQQMLQPFKHLDKARLEGLKTNVMGLNMAADDPKVFTDKANKLIDAYTNSGDENTANILRNGLEMYTRDPSSYKKMTDMVLTALGGSDYATQQAELEYKKSQVKGKEALTKYTEEQVRTEVAKQNKLNAETVGVKKDLSPKLIAIGDEITSGVSKRRKTINDAASILDDMNKAGRWSGDAGAFTQFISKRFGGNKVTAIQNRLKNFISSSIRDMRTPGEGTMSDHDYKVLANSMPAENASAGVWGDYLTRFLDASKYANLYDNLRMKYLTKNRSDLAAVNDFKIDGYEVKEGETFNDFMARNDKIFREKAGLRERAKGAELYTDAPTEEVERKNIKQYDLKMKSPLVIQLKDGNTVRFKNSKIAKQAFDRLKKLNQ